MLPAILTLSFVGNAKREGDGVLARHLSIQVSVSPVNADSEGILRVSDPESLRPLPVRGLVFVLRLDEEVGEDGYAQGQLYSLDETLSYPIRTSLALFDVMAGYVEEARGEP